NVVSFLLFGLDKKKARDNAWRIKESTLILSAVLGGSYGAFLGMKFFHHKTRKPLFRYGIPFLILIETGILAYVLLH
ncbi:MAG: DUF1294 domain-containing protein, partial [Solobacterium sp.]|nr:DUF1294 domain-containing protein [Solobacterium sp.]